MAQHPSYTHRTDLGVHVSQDLPWGVGGMLALLALWSKRWRGHRTCVLCWLCVWHVLGVLLCCLYVAAATGTRSMHLTNPAYMAQYPSHHTATSSLAQFPSHLVGPVSKSLSTAQYPSHVVWQNTFPTPTTSTFGTLACWQQGCSGMPTHWTAPNGHVARPTRLRAFWKRMSRMKLHQ